MPDCNSHNSCRLYVIDPENSVAKDVAECPAEEAPGLISLPRQQNDPDVRRGLGFLLDTVGLLGQQMQHQSPDEPEFS